MGLDIGVVDINYLEQPVGTTYDFLWYLNVNAEEAEWLTGAEGSTFIEITRETMDEQVRRFQSENKLSQNAFERIQRWIAALPWKGDVIMLHFGW